MNPSLSPVVINNSFLPEPVIVYMDGEDNTLEMVRELMRLSGGSEVSADCIIDELGCSREQFKTAISQLIKIGEVIFFGSDSYARFHWREKATSRQVDEFNRKMLGNLTTKYDRDLAVEIFKAGSMGISRNRLLNRWQKSEDFFQDAIERIRKFNMVRVENLNTGLTPRITYFWTWPQPGDSAPPRHYQAAINELDESLVKRARLEKAVSQVIENNGGHATSMSDIRKHCDGTLVEIRSAIKSLVKQDLVEFKGFAKNTRYHWKATMEVASAMSEKTQQAVEALELFLAGPPKSEAAAPVEEPKELEIADREVFSYESLKVSIESHQILVRCDQLKRSYMVSVEELSQDYAALHATEEGDVAVLVWAVACLIHDLKGHKGIPAEYVKAFKIEDNAFGGKVFTFDTFEAELFPADLKVVTRFQGDTTEFPVEGSMMNRVLEITLSVLTLHLQKRNRELVEKSLDAVKEAPTEEKAIARQCDCNKDKKIELATIAINNNLLASHQRRLKHGRGKIYCGIMFRIEQIWEHITCHLTGRWRYFECPECEES